LPPSEFYRLLYSELVLILDGYHARCKREMRLRREENAWVVSWLLLPHKAQDSDPITPDQLMGRKSREQKQFASDEERARAFVAAFRAQSEKKSTSARSKDVK
jgi:hypothetical protein